MTQDGRSLLLILIFGFTMVLAAATSTDPPVEEGKDNESVKLMTTVVSLALNLSVAGFHHLELVCQRYDCVPVVDEFGTSPLSLAVAVGNLPAVELFLSLGLDPNKHESDPSTCEVSIANDVVGKDEMIKRFCQQRTPLHFAMFNRSLASLELLLKHGGNPLLPDSRGWTTLHYAAALNFSTALSPLAAWAHAQDKALSQLWVGDSVGKTPLHVAAMQSDAATVSQLLSFSAPLLALDQLGSSALTLASQAANTDAVQLIIAQLPIPLPTSDTNGRTALHTAAALGHLEAVLRLLERGADVEAADADGCTAVMLAAAFNRFAVVKRLLDRGASVHAHDSNGFTALHHAVLAQQNDIVKSLVVAGASSKWSANTPDAISAYELSQRLPNKEILMLLECNDPSMSIEDGNVL